MREFARLYASYMTVSLISMGGAVIAFYFYCIFRLVEWSRVIDGILATHIEIWLPILIVVIVLLIILRDRGVGRPVA